MPQMTPSELSAFEAELLTLRRQTHEALGDEDLRHLKKIEWWGRLGTLVGLLTAWIAPNPLSALGLALGRSTRWLLMHHISHRGYDRVPNVPARYTSKHFAMGLRRYLDWCDWILPEAWIYEHNVLHHSHTGEERDPDLLERNSEFLRGDRLPRFLKRLILLGLAVSWRPVYYAPKTLETFMPVRGAKDGKGMGLLSTLWLRCYLPYTALQFVLVPLLFAPLGRWAVFSALVNSVLADVITNVHTFVVVGPNHTGDDLYRFEAPPQSRAEHYVRQVLGSVNYRVGGDVTDYAHLWLNYQIEHHLFPDVPMLRYRALAPKVKALCEKYRIPYVQEGVWRRVGKLVDIATGEKSMRWATKELPTRAPSEELWGRAG